MSALLELANRCEQATEPSLDLNVAVCAAFGVSDNQPKMEGVLGKLYCRVSEDERKVEFGTFYEGRDCRMALRDPLPVTASLDAAMTLTVGTEEFGGQLGMLRWAIEMLERAKAPADALPLFICSAALKARDASRIEAQRGETGTGSISEADESLTAESGDAQTPKSVTKGV